jgi:hypothetical protein
MLLPSQRDTPEAYRLVIQHVGGHTICAPEFRCRKQATARVALAARQAHRTGQALGIVLERAQPASDGHGLSGPTDSEQRWTPVEQWGSDVILRILAQNGGPRPASAAEKPAAPAETSVCAEPAPAPVVRPRRDRASHLWHVALVVGLTLLTWSIVTLWLTGGRVLIPGPPTRETKATTLPLAAPGPRSNGVSLPAQVIPPEWTASPARQPHRAAESQARR